MTVARHWVARPQLAQHYHTRQIFEVAWDGTVRDLQEKLAQLPHGVPDDADVLMTGFGPAATICVGWSEGPGDCPLCASEERS